MILFCENSFSIGIFIIKRRKNQSNTLLNEVNDYRIRKNKEFVQEKEEEEEEECFSRFLFQKKNQVKSLRNMTNDFKTKKSSKEKKAITRRKKTVEYYWQEKCFVDGKFFLFHSE